MKAPRLPAISGSFSSCTPAGGRIVGGEGGAIKTPPQGQLPHRQSGLKCVNGKRTASNPHAPTHPQRSRPRPPPNTHAPSPTFAHHHHLNSPMRTSPVVPFREIQSPSLRAMVLPPPDAVSV